MSDDTIAAIASAVGPAGVGVIRMSGPDSIAIAAALIGVAPAALIDRQLVHGIARDRAGERLDDVLAVAMRAPRSFTGEDVAEVHGHGGAWNMRRLLRAVIDGGARLALPGEFSRRAFASGKLDLAQAEGLLAVIEAGSERGWRLAQAHLAGGLGRAVDALRAEATALLAEVEATIDFPEEDVDFLSASGAGPRASALADRVAELARTYAVGRAVREGIEVALVGPVNAGKSSLFNALLGEERAIVTPEPGTTRDYVEARSVWQGIPVTLVDTAGTRDDSASEAEARGQALGARRAREADVRLRVVAADQAPAGALAGALAAADPGELVVMSKCDLAPAPPGAIATSALTGAGIEALRSAVVSRVSGTSVDADEGTIVTTERQYETLRRSASALARGAEAVAASAAPELIAVELREACDALAEVTGGDVGEDVLDALFRRFCIGK